MRSSKCFSLYYTDADMTRWRAFAVSKGLVHGNGEPQIGAAIKELAAMGLEAHMTRDVAGTLRLANEQQVKLLSEVLGGTRQLLLERDNSRGLFDRARDAAQKIFHEAMLPFAARR